MATHLRKGSFYFLTTGAAELCLAIILIICSGIILDKYLHSSGSGGFSLFLLFYGITGGLCITAGIVQNNIIVTIALVLNILAVILSTVGAAVSSVFWQMYRADDACSTDHSEDGECICFHDESFRMSCSNGKVSRSILGVLTISFILMTLTTFLATVLSCSKACCEQSPAEQDMMAMESNSITEPTFVSTQENEDNEKNPLEKDNE